MVDLPDAAPAHLTRAQSDAVIRTRRGRNWAMLVVLVLLALLFYALAFVKLGHH
jgi:uncharacterized integral membrane protein